MYMADDDLIHGNISLSMVTVYFQSTIAVFITQLFIVPS